MLGGKKERREQIACGRNEDAMMDKQKGPCQKPGHTIGRQSMPNVNIPETEKIVLHRQSSISWGGVGRV